MKLYFEDNLDYQQEAIKSVIDLFKGQEISNSEFTITASEQENNNYSLGITSNQLGVGNKLQLLDEDIHRNLNNIQSKNFLPLSEEPISRNFTIEMETGTGKTYVYLRTILELNKNYGFTKFLIIVPSIAVKEGTNKTLQITREHFEGLYPNAKGYEFFQYDSSKTGKVRNFATSSKIQIMVATVGAINKKDINNLYKENEQMGGEKPIDLIKDTAPIIIVDEPQSVDGGLNGKGKEALDAMNPLAILRYSATHVDKHQMVYRLDAIDAYEKKLVKQIEVASLEIDGAFNKPYVKLIETKNVRGSVIAKVELHVQNAQNIKTKILTIEDGDNLEKITHRVLYKNIRVGTITCRENNESIEIKAPNIDVTLRPGESIGGVNPDEIKRLMIRRTIKEHLDKEKRFSWKDLPVKVLSLFFVDSVEHYRKYDNDGNQISGKYAEMFEQEYYNLASSDEYKELFKDKNIKIDTPEIHNGYFSIDKKQRWTDTAENNQVGRDNAERAYNLIMKDKEKLLSFDTKLRFIFSHSALKEGWDNPNVFQICSLREMGTERERRQTIGRGLRLCVDQDGLRRRGNDINTLTVIATEGYEEFAENLQKEIETDTGIRFGIVEQHQFASIEIDGINGQVSTLGIDASKKIWLFLNDKGLLDNDGKIQNNLKEELKNQTFSLPEEYLEYQEKIVNILKKLAGRLDIKNADERKNISLNKEIFLGEDFKQLWERIKYKTTYRVNFDNHKLINESVIEIQNSLKNIPITKTRARFRKAGVEIGKGGISTNKTKESNFTSIDEINIVLPDILTNLQDSTHLTRKSIVEILQKSKHLDDFIRNPQQFIEIVTKSINRTKSRIIVDGIKYQRIGNQDYYSQELFEQEELSGYLKNIIPASKSVYNEIMYDSGIEKKFAKDLESNESIKLYAKLPHWFEIPTPLGSYNPDWAILVESQGQEKLYFVVETKGSASPDDIRPKEQGKINCSEHHFNEVGESDNPVKYILATNVKDLAKHIA